MQQRLCRNREVLQEAESRTNHEQDREHQKNGASVASHLHQATIHTAARSISCPDSGADRLYATCAFG
jgi:hypothetical protein